MAHMQDNDQGLAESDEAFAVYKIALEESRNAFNDLMAQPERIRRNVGALLGFAAIAVSVFGFAAGRPEARSGWLFQIGALVGLLGLIVCAAFVTLPRKLIPSMRADQIVSWGDQGDTERQTVRNLALGIEQNYVSNAEIIKSMFQGQIVATICFGFAVFMMALGTLEA